MNEPAPVDQLPFWQVSFWPTAAVPWTVGGVDALGAASAAVAATAQPAATETPIVINLAFISV